MAVTRERFGTMPDGRPATLYTMTNENGLKASVTDLGAVWVSLFAPDRDGKMEDVLLGYDGAAGYLENGPHFGSIVGRVANRTAGGRFTLEGKEYILDQNNGKNNLHSGNDYYDRRLWEAAVSSDETSVAFTLESPDGDQGFPGAMKLTVTYRLTKENVLEIEYRAVSDKATAVNLTNHGYFNLAGQGKGSVLDHEIRILADRFLPTTADSIPTGEEEPVENTPMDFRERKTVGAEIGTDFLPLIQAGGYDHNWCLNHKPGEYSLAAEAKDPKSGRLMKVYTDLPGLQLYTANFLENEAGKGGVRYNKREAFCFETQFYPDSLNHREFPSIIVPAGTVFYTKTGYEFQTEK